MHQLTSHLLEKAGLQTRWCVDSQPVFTLPEVLTVYYSILQYELCKDINTVCRTEYTVHFRRITCLCSLHNLMLRYAMTTPKCTQITSVSVNSTNTNHQPILRCLTWLVQRGGDGTHPHNSLQHSRPIFWLEMASFLPTVCSTVGQ
jgi:hypothetical protein